MIIKILFTSFNLRHSCTVCLIKIMWLQVTQKSAKVFITCEQIKSLERQLIFKMDTQSHTGEIKVLQWVKLTVKIFINWEEKHR